MTEQDDKKILIVENDFGIPETIRSACEEIAFEFRPYPPIFLDTRVPSAPKNLLRGIDVDKEYELIKQKKSTLPARLRQLVVKRKEVDDAKKG
jgi:hypothetical protein